MGIAVAGLVLPDTGVTLANAYVSFGAGPAGANSLVVTPVDDAGNYTLRCASSVWNSLEDRLALRAPLTTTQCFAACDATATVAQCMAALYDALKAGYPGYVDVFEAGQP